MEGSVHCALQIGLALMLLFDGWEGCAQEYSSLAKIEAGDVLINEILYEAIPADAEYIELFNKSEKCILIKRIHLGKVNAEGKIGSVKAITETDVLLEPGGLIWVCSNREAVLVTYHYHEIENCFVVPTRLSYSDEGGTVVVLNDEGEVIDELVYGKYLHNTTLKETKGIALERISDEQEGEVRLHWTSAMEENGDGYGSPGRPNRSQSLPENDKRNNFLERTPEVFTPDGDGVEDQVEIRVTDDRQDFTLRLLIYDVRGRLVYRLADGIPVYAAGSFHWNGRDRSGRLLPAGIYIIYAELNRKDGYHCKARETCVLSR